MSGCLSLVHLRSILRAAASLSPTSRRPLECVGLKVFCVSFSLVPFVCYFAKIKKRARRRGLLLFTCNFLSIPLPSIPFHPLLTISFCSRHFEFPDAVNFSVLPFPLLFIFCLSPATNRFDLHNSEHISTHSFSSFSFGCGCCCCWGCLHIF